MAMTYEETNNLRNDQNFRGRVSVACVHFANYIIDEPGSVPAHSTRTKWAQGTLANPDLAVAQCIATVVNDQAVQTAGGAAITDADLQTAVETSINKLL
jgi:hypothetical protein